MFLSLQYARGIASLMVVYAHFSGFKVFEVLGLPEFGGVGVDLFFVISGFVMWESGQKHTVSQFVIRRIARIVPAYWFYTSVLVAIAWCAPALAPNIKFDAWALASSYFFIPYTNFQGQQNPILLQGWTLNYEAFFYLVFGFSLLLQTRGRRFAFVTCVLLLLLASGNSLLPKGATTTMVTSPMLLEFILGMALSEFLRCWSPKSGLAMALGVAGATLLVVLDISIDATQWRAIYFGIPSTLLLMGLLGLEPMLRRRPLRPLHRIGDISYSLYLCHPFALSGVAIGLRRLAEYLNTDAASPAMGIAFVCLGVGVSCVIARISFERVEKPMARHLIGLLTSGRGATVVPIAQASQREETK
jgi:exopolysaccharide production protein ExoZ